MMFICPSRSLTPGDRRPQAPGGQAGPWMICAATCLLLVTGCRGLSWPPSLSWSALSSRSQNPADDTEEDRRTTPSRVGDYVTISGLGMITLEGVGLITGLDGTGGDPRPSPFRMMLLKDMQRRGVTNAKALLRSPNTALVVVRAYLPPLIRKGESFDVEVRLPPGSEATSLNGGWLMEADLSERAVVPGEGVLAGHVFARAKGHVLISHGEGDKGELAGVLRRGRVPGGGISRRDRDLTIGLKNRYRSVRMARRIADRIGKRFYAYNRHGVREPLANPKTDRTIMLKVHPRYRDNFPRYLQVIRHIPIKEDDVSRQVRMQQLAGQLEAVETSRKSALALEAIGSKAIPFLKTGLDHPELEVRFHAASALAYLDDNSGAAALAEAARHHRAFRVYALAALSTLEDAPSQLALRKLLKPITVCQTEGCDHQGQAHETACPGCQTAGTLKQSAELQYGAFRALWTRDRLDPTIRGEKIGDLFTLHEIDADGRPLIHLTQLRQPEIVLFGSDQSLRTPLAVQAGNHVWVNSQSGSDSITVSRYQVGRSPRREVVSTRIADVIKGCVKLGATYPDIVQMLVQAQRQQNIPGLIAIDAVPRTGRVYVRGENRIKTRLSTDKFAPNLFPQARGDAEDQPESNERDLLDTAAGPNTDPDAGHTADGDTDDERGAASLADRRREGDSTRSGSDSETRPQDDSQSKYSFLEKLFR